MPEEKHSPAYMEAVRRVVAEAPPLTMEQRETIARILAPVTAPDPDELYPHETMRRMAADYDD